MTGYRSLITVTDYGGAQSVRGKPRWKRASCAWVSPYVSIIYLLLESALARRRILEKPSQIVIIIIDDASFATRFSFSLSFLFHLYFFFYSFPISDFFLFRSISQATLYRRTRPTPPVIWQNVELVSRSDLFATQGGVCVQLFRKGKGKNTNVLGDTTSEVRGVLVKRDATAAGRSDCQHIMSCREWTIAITF